MATRTIVAATKTTIPRSRRPLVARPGLAARLDGDYRMALVSAPAGYGKTATLAAWASQQPFGVAWLSCDPMDGEPTRFMAGLLTAIDAQWPGVADDAFVLLERDGATTYDPAVAVANELAAVSGSGVIVIDDLHLAAPAPTTLTAFVDALPERFRFVAGTRFDPPLSLARLRLHGHLVELRGDELRFGPDELAAFLALQGVTLDAGQLGHLHELTEGWPAGAQLAAIALQRGTADEEFLSAFAGTDRAVADFLLSEVVAGLPAHLVDFLVSTAVFDAFDAELCAAVTGVDDASAVLDRLVAANLFVVPLDERAHWFRYHHLFGAFLRARLASLGRARVRAAHEQASRALEARGFVDLALRHAMAAGDADRTGAVLRETVARSMSISDAADDAARAVRMWLHELGPSSVHDDPTLLLELVIGVMGTTRADDAPAWLRRVAAAHPDADGPLTALIEGAWGELHQNRGQPVEALRRMVRAGDALGGRAPNVGLLPLLPVATARAHIQAGELERAIAVLDDGLAHPAGNPVADDVRTRGLAAFLAARAGELVRALELARGARAAADELGLGDHEPGRIHSDLALVAVHVERHEHEAAGALMDAVRSRAESSRRTTLESLVTIEHARLARAVGDEATADAALARARLHFADPDEAFRRVLDEEAAAQALRFAPEQAAALVAALDPRRAATTVLRARLALAQGDDRAAGVLLAEVPPPTSRRGHVELEVLRALSVLERDVERANAHLRSALRAGQRDRLVATVIEPGPPAHKLLASYTPTGAEERYVAALLDAVDRTVAPVRSSVAQPLVDPLSQRELTVLRYLCSRLTYVEIAAALFVSPNTLKSHVRSVYRKLAVASRADAVAAGRHLGLI